MLSIGDWKIVVLHLASDLLVEELWEEELGWIWVLDILLVGGVVVVELLGTIWSPSLRCDEVVIEDFFGIDLHKSSIAIVSNSTTVVGLGNEILDGGPVDWSSLVVGFIDGLSVNLLTKIVGNQIVAYGVVRIVEGIGNIPAE